MTWCCLADCYHNCCLSMSELSPAACCWGCITILDTKATWRANIGWVVVSKQLIVHLVGLLSAWQLNLSNNLCRFCCSLSIPGESKQWSRWNAGIVSSVFSMFLQKLLAVSLIVALMFLDRLWRWRSIPDYLMSPTEILNLVILWLVTICLTMCGFHICAWCCCHRMPNITWQLCGRLVGTEVPVGDSETWLVQLNSSWLISFHWMATQIVNQPYHVTRVIN